MQPIISLFLVIYILAMVENQPNKILHVPKVAKEPCSAVHGHLLALAVNQTWAIEDGNIIFCLISTFLVGRGECL